MTISAISELEIHQCCVCGTEFALPRLVLENRRETENNFYCPNGHSLIFKKSEVQKLTEELAGKTEAHRNTIYELRKVQREYETLKKKCAPKKSTKRRTVQ